MFGLNLIARYYLVLILKIELVDRSEQYDHDGYQQVQQVVTGLMQQNPDTFLLKRDWGDLILIMKGETSEYLEEEHNVLLDEIHGEIAKTRYQVTVGVGSSKNQIEEISQSFIEALRQRQLLVNWLTQCKVIE